MTIEGGCLCGGVRFAVERAVGPFELCHCTRCRKASGSAFVAGLGVDVRDYRLLSGAELIEGFEAPVRERPPGFRTAFYTRCGSPVPDPAWAYIRRHPGLRIDGHNVAVYWGEAGIEVGGEVVRAIDATAELVASATPAGTVVTAAHFGPCSEVGRTHEAVCAWCAQHGRALAGPFWEVYGDWSDDPSALRTDVFYLLR